MASDKQNLQDAFLNHVRKTKVPVTIFLINGVKLQGVITWFDSFCVLLELTVSRLDCDLVSVRIGLDSELRSSESLSVAALLAPAITLMVRSASVAVCH